MTSKLGCPSASTSELCSRLNAFDSKSPRLPAPDAIIVPFGSSRRNPDFRLPPIRQHNLVPDDTVLHRKPRATALASASGAPQRDSTLTPRIPEPFVQFGNSSRLAPSVRAPSARLSTTSRQPAKRLQLSRHHAFQHQATVVRSSTSTGLAVRTAAAATLPPEMNSTRRLRSNAAVPNGHAPQPEGRFPAPQPGRLDVSAEALVR